MPLCMDRYALYYALMTLLCTALTLLNHERCIDDNFLLYDVFPLHVSFDVSKSLYYVQLTLFHTSTFYMFEILYMLIEFQYMMGTQFN